MSSISSLTKMISGLNAAQKGLQVTGQNISNTNTKGYTRQQLLQHESGYINIGKNGGRLMQVGLGVTPTEIRQIRDELADKRIRTENSVLNFYQAQTATVSEIETILDEPYGEGITKMLNNFWAQTQKLNTAPDGVEERLSFIQASKVLIEKANDIANSLVTYQENLNSEVIKSVNRINDIIKGVQEYNEKISKAEINGDNANDYRDQRNLLIDELSAYGQVDYYEEADNRIVLKFENHIVVDKKFLTTLKLDQTVEGSPFVKPTWSDTKEDVYHFNTTITAAKGNDTGKLKALLLERGNDYVKAGTTWADIALNDNFSVDETGNSYLIPKIQKKLNDFISSLVQVVNSSFDGTGIGAEKGKAGVPVFVLIPPKNDPAPNANDAVKYPDGESSQKYKDDYEAYKEKYWPPDVTNKIKYPNGDSDPKYIAAHKAFMAKMLPGDIQVNPELLANGGYNKLGTVDPKADGSGTNNTGDNSKVTEFLSKWSQSTDWYKDRTDPTSPHYKKVDVMSFYSEFVTDIGTEGSNYSAKASEKYTSVVNIENERQAMGGVSQDEEFSNMMKYQHAYNASARVITVLDSMLETIINKL